MSLTFKPKAAKCAVCKGEYMRLRPLMKVCGPSCAITHAKAQSERKQARAGSRAQGDPGKAGRDGDKAPTHKESPGRF